MLVSERIDRVLSAQLGRDVDWLATTTLREGLDLDSIDMVRLVMGLEEEFGIAIPDDMCEPLHGFTVGSLAGWLEPQLSTRRAMFA